MRILTDSEVDFFRVNGYLIRRGAVEKELVERCRQRTWENYEESENDPETWTPGHKGSFLKPVEEQVWAKTGPFLELANHESTWGVACELHGRENLREPEAGSTLLIFPDSGAEWSPPQNGHIDDSFMTAINTMTIMDRIDPRGGGFTIWPGSHHMAHQYFLTHDIRDGYPNEHSSRRPGGWGGAPPWPMGTGVEFTGGPGDTAYVHNWMCHGQGHNVSTKVRMLAQSGFYRNDWENDDKRITSELWHWWKHPRLNRAAA